MSDSNRVGAGAPAADHIVAADGSISLTDAGQQVIEAFLAAEEAYDRLRRCWAGAYVASLFVRHTWLQSLRITLTATAEYDDSGGTFRSVSSSVDEVLAVTDSVLPESVQPDGGFDQVQATGLLEEELEQNDFDLYTSLRPEEDDFSDVALVLDRGAAGGPLQGPAISGARAFEVWLRPSTDTDGSKLC